MRKILLIIFLLVSLVSMPYVAFAGSQQTSSTTADTIIDNARSYLNQDDVSGVTPFCSDAQMLVWLNDGMVDLTTLGLSGQSTEAITLVADTIEYSITSSYTKVVAVFYVDSDSKEKALKQGNVWSVGRTEADGMPAADVTPVFWYEWAGKIGVYPPLAAVSGTTETINVKYVVRPAALATSGAAVTTPALYDTALTLYIAIQACIRDDRPLTAKVLQERYDKKLGITKENLNTQPIEPQAIFKK